ncbi:MAG: antibiotic biosynthesis monooxygenase [Acidobacteriia bacterium]|nr:antibiotic biosynthesis monooxygenase [Terriglobia bacterium]
MARLLFVLPPAALLVAAAAGLVVGQGPAGAPQRALYVVTHIDVTPNGSAETATQVAQLAVESRKDPGYVRFEVLRSVDRMNHFEVLEVWRTRQDFEAHEAQEHSKRFREKIQSFLGSPFDQRLYYKLE